MLTKANKNYPTTNFPVRVALFLQIIFCVLAITADAQKTETKKISNKTNLPVWQSYKGVGIGMTADEVRKKLGNPKSEDAGGFFYVFSDTENAQILIDGEKKVRVVLVTFSAEYQNPPKFDDIFGKTATAEPRPDGSIYKMVKYPDAGYWVSYNRMAGEKALVIVMIQKM